MRTFYINGAEVLVDRNWTISDKINSRSTVNMTVVDLLSLSTIDEGDSINIYNGTDKIFSGIVLTITKTEPYPNNIVYQVAGVDNSALADKRVIATSYVNTLAGTIVQDLITQKLSEEGITAGTIASGVVIKKAVFNYIKVSQALDYLKDLTGLVWNIDKDKKLNFYDRATNVSSVAISNNVQHKGFTQKTSLDRYRNVQYIRGGKTKTSLQTNEVPSPKPDGESRNFILRFPIAEKPTIEINLNGAGWTTVAASDIGVNGLDTGKKWYFTFDSNVLTQDSSQTVLSATDAIRVDYSGLRNLFVSHDNVSEISARKAKEAGTSGIYENLAIEKTIDDSNQAFQFAEGLINTYGEVMDSVQFSTEVSGIDAGQLIMIDKPLFGIYGQYLIESVSIRLIGNSVEYQVNALDGASIGGWEQFFKKLINTDKDFVIAENEVIILLSKSFDTENYQSNYGISTIVPIFPSETLYPSDTLYPGTKSNEVILND